MPAPTILEQIFNPVNYFLFGVGSTGSFLAAMFAVGGSGLFIPMMIFITPLFFGPDVIDMHMAAALSIGTIWFSSLSASLSLRSVLKQQSIKPLILVLAIPSMIGGLIGSTSTKWVPDIVLRAIFPVGFFAANAILLKKATQ
ncbi:hypothetical protein GEMRC1_011496 [Eukaryota sp. GEM-RC1]